MSKLCSKHSGAVVIALLLFSFNLQAQLIDLELSQNSESVNFQAQGRAQWDYKLKSTIVKDSLVYELLLPKVSATSANKLAQFKSPFIKNIIVSENEIDGKTKIEFITSSKDLEAFDYLIEDPSRLVIDFYFDPIKKSSATPKTQAVDVKKITTEKNSATTQSIKNVDRKPAMTDVLLVAPAKPGEGGANSSNSTFGLGLFDGGDPDYKRFAIEDHEISEKAIIKSKQNFYLSFPMLEFPIRAWTQIQKNNPIYEIRIGDSEENKRARLVLTLFKNKRNNVFLKTADWFVKNYPDSEYREMIQYMTADVLLELYNESNNVQYYDLAIQKYIQTMNEFPKSDLNERTSLKIGFLALKRGDVLNAMRYFGNHIDRKDLKGKSSIDIARLGLAEAYLRLNKFEEAINQYDVIEATSPFQDYKIEAAYRRGDIEYKRENFKGAIQAYQSAFKKYPQSKSLFPNTSFNLSEALFTEKKYKDSLQNYTDYLKRFPDTAEAPYALTRVGETLEILGADPAKSMGAWMETYFRYGESPRAIVARLRTLSTRMKSMNATELEEAVKNINELSKKSDLKNVDQFATIMISDGYFKRGDYPQALDLLQKYHKANPSLVENKHITQRIQSNIHKLMANQYEKGEYLKALRTHKKYFEDWMKKANRWDDTYVLGQTYENLGANKDAYQQYEKLYNNILAKKDTEEFKEKTVQEMIPEVGTLLLRMANTLAEQKRYNDSFDALRKIKNPENLTEEEQIERVQLAVDLYKQKGDEKTALRFVNDILNEWKGKPTLLAAPLLQKAEIELQQNKEDLALTTLEKLATIDSKAKGLDKNAHSIGLEKLSQLQVKLKQPEQAIATLTNLLNSYEDSKSLDSFRYKLGELYFNKGEIQKASEVWEKFKNQDSTFWSNLAQEQLKNANWRADYNKYIKRIPAMVKSEEFASEVAGSKPADSENNSNNKETEKSQ